EPGARRDRTRSCARQESNSMVTTVSRPNGHELSFGSKPSTWFANAQLSSATCVPEEGVGAYDTLRKYGATPLTQERIPRDYFKMPAEERTERIWSARRAL